VHSAGQVTAQTVTESAVVLLSFRRHRGARKQPIPLPDGDEAHAEGHRRGGAEQETARLDSHDPRDAMATPGLHQSGHDGAEGVAVGEDTPDVRMAPVPAEVCEQSSSGRGHQRV
jgi:hypothetical protein